MIKTNKKCIVDLGKVRIERRIWINKDNVEVIKVKGYWHALSTFCIQNIEED